MKNNLKQIRNIMGITQKQLADHLGTTNVMISMWENNPKEKIPKIRVGQICQYLNVNDSDLYTVDLDIRLLKVNALQNKIKKLEQRYLSL